MKKSLIEHLWWRFIPGETVRVKWPKGQVRVGPSHQQGWSGIGEYFEYIESADPNDHYRPFLEKNVGKQGWDWNWEMGNMDATENKLTIRIRRPKTHWCSIIGLLWN